MSYSLRINAAGDLDVSSGVMKLVRGIEKLTQDLSLWMREPYKTDRFHVLYGSILDQYVGSIVNQLAEHEIRAEAIRVLNAYQQIQLAAMKDNPSKFDLDELLDTVESVNVKVSYDAVFVDIRFRTASQKVGTVKGTVSV
jgi:phage baseplate assembly protein W